MSHPGKDAFESWFERNEADLEQRYCQAHLDAFEKWCWEVFINTMPEGDSND